MTDGQSAASEPGEDVSVPAGQRLRRPYTTPVFVECGPVAKLLVDTTGKPKGVGELVEHAYQ